MYQHTKKTSTEKRYKQEYYLNIGNIMFKSTGYILTKMRVYQMGT